MPLVTRSRRFVAALALGLATVAACADDGLASLANAHFGIGIDRRSGAIAELVDRRSGHDFGSEGAGLWEIQVRQGDRAVRIIPRDAAKVDVVRPDPSGLTLMWSGFAGLSTGLVVQVSIKMKPDARASRWTIGVLGVPPALLEQVRFPIVRGIPPQDAERLAVPMWMGQIVHAPRQVLAGADRQGRRMQWHYPGELSLQCLAFYGERAGLYLACDDTNAFRKAFAFFGNGDGTIVGCDAVHWPEAAQEARPGEPNAWELPYAMILEAFRGDWFTAAERYRTWGTNQSWAIQSRLARRAVPDWVEDTALWVWNRGRSPGVLEPAAELKTRLGLPVSVFWHWWHGCAYDIGFPEYLPPREGTEAFREAVARGQRRGVNTLVYMNQRLWGMTTRSWETQRASEWAVKGADGKIQPEVYNTFTRAPCASMCLGTPFWRDTYATLAQRAVTELGVSGIYMDQACLSLSCFDPAHGHPTGGGRYWVNGFKLLASDIRKRCGPGPTHASRTPARPALAGEGCGEPWLPHLDLMLSLQVSRERYAAPDGWETIPFFHAVYHPYAVLFGNYSSLTMPPYDDLWPAEYAPREPLKLLDPAFSTQFRLEQARSFVWGQQLTIANFLPGHLTSRAPDMDYLMRLAKVRRRALPYLLHGTMLRPPTLEVARQQIPISRLSIYAGQQGALTAFEKEVSLAIAAAWRSPKGKVAVALASISDKELPVRLVVPAELPGVKPDSKITRLDHRQREAFGRLSGAAVTLTLPPRAAWVLELAGGQD